MKFFELELNNEIIRFRLRSEDCLTIESKNKCKMLDYIRGYSHTTIVTLLQYLRKSDVPNFSQKDACDLMDKLIDNGFTLEKIVFDIIYESLVISGFLTKEELEEMKTNTKESTEKIKEKVMETLANQ